jgi:hypothetical protein
MGTRRLADGLATLGAEHRLRRIHGTTVRTSSACYLALLLFHLHGSAIGFLLQVSRHAFLGAKSALQRVVLRIIGVVTHILVFKSQMQNYKKF